MKTICILKTVSNSKSMNIPTSTTDQISINPENTKSTATWEYGNYANNGSRANMKKLRLGFPEIVHEVIHALMEARRPKPLQA